MSDASMNNRILAGLRALIVRDNTSDTNATSLIVHDTSTDPNPNPNSRDTSTQITTIDVEVQNLLREVDNVKQNSICDSTRDQYTSANVSFMKFIFEHFPHVLKPDFLELYRNSKETNSPREFTKEVKNSLGRNNKLPVHLDRLSADMFLAYLISLKRPNGNYYSVSYYEGKKAAFLNLISESGNEWDRSILREIAFVMLSLKKTIAKYNSDNGIQPVEGKEHMSWACFRLCCQLFVEDGSPSSIFGLFFILMQWSLIARSDSVQKISLDQLTWVSDHLKVYYPKHKGDQIGLTKDEPRHIYSNPIQPEVCPIRAMASYFLTFPQILQDGKDLFPGDSQHTRFHDILLKIIKNNEDDFFQIGVSAEDIGTHSVRKGAATYCCAGVHPGPPVISVCLRAGWSVGRVKERYLKYENAGDELVGRTLTGIPPTSCKFGISPVYFINDSATEENIEVMVATSFPLAQESLIGLTYILTSSFIYHEEWTVANTRDEDSPLLQSPYFSINTAYPGRKDFVTTALPWEDKPNAPSLTGIPIHCSLLNKLVELAEGQKTLPEQMLQKFVAELDQRDIGGGLNAQRILDGIKQSNDELRNLIMSNLESQHHLLPQHPAAIIQTTMHNAGNNEETTFTPVPREVPLLSSEDGIWGHFWNNKVRVLPESFRFPPKKSLLSLWLSWHVPDVSRKICPYRILQCSDVLHLVRGPNKLREMRLVIDVLITNIQKHNDWYNKYLRGNKNVHQLSQLFHAFKHVFINILSDKRKQRFGQLSWETFVRDARKLKNNLIQSEFVPPICTQYTSSLNTDCNQATARVQQIMNTDNNESQLRTSRLLSDTNTTNSTTPPTVTQDDNTETGPRQRSLNLQTSNRNHATQPEEQKSPTCYRNRSPQPNERKTPPTLSNRSPQTLNRTSNPLTRKQSSKPITRTKSLLYQRTLRQQSRTSTNRNKRPVVTQRKKLKTTNTRKRKPSKLNNRNVKPARKANAGLNAFDSAFSINETALARPSKEDLELNEFGSFKSVQCRKCKQFPTQHRCTFEIANGFEYHGKKICGLPICALCSADLGMEEGVFRCAAHTNKQSIVDL